MKMLASLLVTVALGGLVTVSVADFLNPGTEKRTETIQLARSRTPVLHCNHDSTFEDAYAWSDAGVVPPDFGAFAEGFEVASEVWVVSIELWITQDSSYTGQPLDLYIWEQGVTAPPGTVLWMEPVVLDPHPPEWPEARVYSFDVNPPIEVSGEFSVGCWGNWPDAPAGFYIAADSYGPAGGVYSWTNIASGLGYPEGWQHFDVLWDLRQFCSLGEQQSHASSGIGVWVDPEPCSPVESGTWGSIKSLFR